jgi:ketosteroid isomerase-like protein
MNRLRLENKGEESYAKRLEDIISDLKEQLAFYKREVELIQEDD